MKTDAERMREILDGSAPFPPMCEQYLDLGVLWPTEVRKELIEHFTEVYLENPGPNRTTTPRTYARQYVATLDDVTVNLMHTAFSRKLIEFSVFKKIRANDLKGVRARDYVLMMIAIRGLEARSGSFRQFCGLYEIAELEPELRANFEVRIETDDQYRKHSACLRYAVAVTNGLSMREGEALFLRRNSEDLVIQPRMNHMLWSMPEQADRIAEIVIQRKAQDPEVIAQILDGTIAPSLGSGTL